MACQLLTFRDWQKPILWPTVEDHKPLVNLSLTNLALGLMAASAAAAPADDLPETKERHWAFVVPSRPVVPEIVNRKSDILFIISELLA